MHIIMFSKKLTALKLTNNALKIFIIYMIAAKFFNMSVRFLKRMKQNIMNR